jgi:hypothetical protein
MRVCQQVRNGHIAPGSLTTTPVIIPPPTLLPRTSPLPRAPTVQLTSPVESASSAVRLLLASEGYRERFIRPILGQQTFPMIDILDRFDPFTSPNSRIEWKACEIYRN